MLLAKPKSKLISILQLGGHLSDLITEVSGTSPTRVNPRETFDHVQHSLFLVITWTLRIAERHSVEDGPC